MTIASTRQLESDVMPVRKFSDTLELPPLPYAPDALEPRLSRRTLATHHGHHHAGYLDKTRAFVRQTPLDGVPIERIAAASAHETHGALFRSAAQALHHAFYWRSLRPGEAGCRAARSPS